MVLRNIVHQFLQFLVVFHQVVALAKPLFVLVYLLVVLGGLIPLEVVGVEVADLVQSDVHQHVIAADASLEQLNHAKPVAHLAVQIDG